MFFLGIGRRKISICAICGKQKMMFMQPQPKIWIELGRRLDRVAQALHSREDSVLESKSEYGLYRAAFEAGRQNPWFTHASVVSSLQALAHMLRPEAVEKWLNGYLNEQKETEGTQPSNQQQQAADRTRPDTARMTMTGSPTPPDNEQESRFTRTATILLIMAGNIPLVGSHDMICVLASGHHLMAKLSSQDRQLPLAMGHLISEIEPAYADRIQFLEGRASGFDAVIATGSNNSSRYFDYYFGRYPHIIRHNRTSMALLSGQESAEELAALGDDVFSYFGLGCRNVSMLWLPDHFDLELLTNAWSGYENLRMHSKFMNNYDYQKAVMLVNNVAFSDPGFCLLREDQHLHSPVSVIHYQRYGQISEVHAFLQTHRDELQCIMCGRDLLKSLAESKVFPKDDHHLPAYARSLNADLLLLPFGSGQRPELWDYADGVDTMRFLQFNG
jgi:hypothetical protein